MSVRLRAKWLWVRVQLQSLINGLVTPSAFTAVKNKIPDVSRLVKKADYITKISQLAKTLTDHNHDKYITTPEFNKLTVENFVARLKEVNLVAKADFDCRLKKLDKKITLNKTKNWVAENELKKLETFDSI